LPANTPPLAASTSDLNMDESAEHVWDECLDIIRDNVRRQSYKTWFEPLEAQSLVEEDGLKNLTIQLPSRFYYEWLEEHYFSLLRKTITKVLGKDGRLLYDVVIEQENPDAPDEGASMELPARRPDEETPSAAADSPNQSSPAQQEPHTPREDASEPHDSSSSEPPSSESPDRPNPSSSPPTDDPVPQQSPVQHSDATEEQSAPPVQNPFAIPGIQDANIDSQLNESYTFERFIEGDCNELARSAAWTIAQEPGGTSFNPYLIYGGVGLGKTHLIQAVGNYVTAHFPDKTALYVSSERFTTEFVQSIQQNRINEFSMFYRQVDVLIVDDVQFFSGKEKTQEEFFHIFNALHQAGKQIVLSADRPPRDIEGIEERLLSRFQWGLSADVQPPGFDTRVEILERKAADDGIDLSSNVIEFIAHNVKSNIRELEGALIRLLAHSTLHQRDLDLALAKEVLHDLMEEKQPSLTIEDIQGVVCEYLNIDEERVRSKTRKREVVRARQIAMYFCKRLTQNSLKTIGLHFGGRDHSTVIHANNTVEDRMEDDEQFQDTVEEIKRKIELRSR
jgi:chromosomal replication initiator protein